MKKHITILLTVFCLLTTSFIGVDAYEDMPTKGNALKHIMHCQVIVGGIE